METVPKPEPAIIQQGRRWQILSLRTGRQHPVLQRLAERHAAEMARQGYQSHQGYEARFSELYRQLPDCHDFAEVVNESWAGQREQTAAWEMFNSWQQSPGHWSQVHGRCAFWGYAMAYCQRNQTWYACGLFAQQR